MTRKTKFVIAICLVAQSFTSLVLSFVYANRKKELSKAFLGMGIIGGLGGAYLLYNEYMESKNDSLAFSDGDWCDGDCDCCDDDDMEFFDEGDADDINFTIAGDETPAEESAEETENE